MIQEPSTHDLIKLCNELAKMGMRNTIQLNCWERLDTKMMAFQARMTMADQIVVEAEGDTLDKALFKLAQRAVDRYKELADTYEHRSDNARYTLIKFCEGNAPHLKNGPYR